jgi:hypothetical protein
MMGNPNMIIPYDIHIYITINIYKTIKTNKSIIYVTIYIEYIVFIEMKFHYVVQAGLELVILLPSDSEMLELQVSGTTPSYFDHFCMHQNMKE